MLGIIGSANCFQTGYFLDGQVCIFACDDAIWIIDSFGVRMSPAKDICCPEWYLIGSHFDCELIG